jgi:hypothetical protein
MNQDSHNDDILFDRLVDGELSSAERRALLESLDSRPQGWRQCALAFLEAQSWKTQLREVAAEPAVAAVAEKFTAPNRATRRTTIRAAAQWLAVAAALLVAFKIGGWQGDSAPSVATDSAQTDEQVASTPPTTVTPPNAKPSDALNLWVRDDGGQMRRVRVPLVDASALESELGLKFQTGVPEDVRNNLQNRGYSVQSKRQYAPLWLDNGRPMIVPVEDTKIVPVSNKVY